MAGLEIALRDPDDPAGNARRVVAACDAARSEGLLDDDARVRRAPHVGADGRLAGRRRRRRGERAPAEVPHRRPRGRTCSPPPTRWPTGSTPRSTARRRSSAPPGCTTPSATRARSADASTSTASSTCCSRPARPSTARRPPTWSRPARAAEAVRGLAADARDADLAGARRWFTSFGSCSVAEPLDDLVSLGLLDGPAPTGRRAATDLGRGRRGLPVRRRQPAVRRVRPPRRGARAWGADRRPGARPRAGRGGGDARRAPRLRGASLNPLMAEGRPARDVRTPLGHRPAHRRDRARPGRAAPGAARRGDAAPAVRGRRLRRLLRLARPRLQRRPDLPPRRRAAAAQLEAPPGRLPRPRRHGRRLGHRRRPARRASGRRRRTTRPTFGPSPRLDIEAELGFVVGVPSELGDPVAVDATSPTTSSASSASTTGRPATSRPGSTSRSGRSSASPSRRRSRTG